MGYPLLVWVQVPSSAPLHTLSTLRDDRNGRLAQLVEHGVYTAGVGGSSPSPPTRRCLLVVPHLSRATMAFWPAEIAQLVEHATENRSVDSSILSLGTITCNPHFADAGPIGPVGSWQWLRSFGNAYRKSTARRSSRRARRILAYPTPR